MGTSHGLEFIPVKKAQQNSSESEQGVDYSECCDALTRPSPHDRRNGLPLKFLEVLLDNLPPLTGSPLNILPSTEQTYLAKLLPLPGDRLNLLITCQSRERCCILASLSQLRQLCCLSHPSFRPPHGVSWCFLNNYITVHPFPQPNPPSFLPFPLYRLILRALSGTFPKH